jgi:type III secretion protein V
VRISLKNHLCYQYARPDGLHVWLLTPELEEQLRDSLRQTQNDLFFALTHEQISAILPLIANAFPVDTPESAVLLVAQDLRSPMRGLIQEEFHYVPVLSFAELQPNLAVNVLGRIELDPAAYSLTTWES